METNLYTVTIPPMMRAIEAFSNMLEKAREHAAKHATKRRPAEYFESALLGSHLIFDQFPLLMQVQRVSDNAKNGAARLADIEAPTMEDTETTIAELRQRLEKTLDFMRSIKPAQVIGQDRRKVTLPYYPDKHLLAFDYATQYLIPNFYFHLVTAYAIMRKNGVPLGKGDYIIELALRDN